MTGGTSTVRVWLVEDEPRVSHLVRTALPAPGFTVTHVSTVRAAYNALMTVEADVALVDLGLPDGDGLAVVAALHRHRPDVAVLVLTVDADRERIAECLRSGASGYLLKQDLVARLEASVRDVLEGRAPLSPEAARVLLEAIRRPEATGARALLTTREVDVLAWLGRGLTYEQAAEALGISANTVRTHVRSLYDKLGVTGKAEAVAWAMRHGILD